jgi:hypothetical protein
MPIIGKWSPIPPVNYAFMKNLLVASLILLIFSCTGNETETTEKSEVISQKVDNSAHHISEITAVFDAHGGFDTWASLKSLSYKMGGSTTLTELQNRYTRIDSEDQTVGFDGENVWVYPASENADRQRMRYNLMFYFYAFPFVVGDPGVNYEVLPPIDLAGEQYNQVKVSYDAGVGDAPNDSYIICSNPETNQMEWLLYTATFGGAPKETYSLIRYEDWKTYDGVLLPGKLQWYTYKEGVVGDPRGEGRTFENVIVSTEYPSMDNFTMPEGASIAQMPVD